MGNFHKVTDKKTLDTLLEKWAEKISFIKESIKSMVFLIIHIYNNMLFGFSTGVTSQFNCFTDFTVYLQDVKLITFPVINW